MNEQRKKSSAKWKRYCEKFEEMEDEETDEVKSVNEERLQRL